MRAPTHDKVKNGMVIIAAGDGSPTKLGPETDWKDRHWYLYLMYQSSQSEETLENSPSPEEIRNSLL
jgi:hypothetical protein